VPYVLTPHAHHGSLRFYACTPAILMVWIYLRQNWLRRKSYDGSSKLCSFKEPNAWLFIFATYATEKWFTELMDWVAVSLEKSGRSAESRSLWR
jgi:hypothetical protein